MGPLYEEAKKDSIAGGKYISDRQVILTYGNTWKQGYILGDLNRFGMSLSITDGKGDCSYKYIQSVTYALRATNTRITVNKQPWQISGRSSD